MAPAAAASPFVWLFGAIPLFQIVVAVVGLLGGIVGLLGGIAGLYSFWKLHLEGPRLKILPGDRLFLVAPADATAPINTTLVIENTGARIGTLQLLEAEIKGPGGLDARFVWGQFFKYDTGHAVVKEFDPYPVSIAAKSSIPLRVQFELRPASPGFTWSAGEYTMTLRGWINRASRKQAANIEARLDFGLSSHEAGLMSVMKSGDPFVFFTARVRAWE